MAIVQTFPEKKGLNTDDINDIASASTTIPAVVIGDANNYSTTEKVIGKWINGKPLYQRVVEGTTGGTNAWVDVINIGSTCIIVEGSCYIAPNTGSFATYPIPYGLNDGRIAYNYKSSTDTYTPGMVAINIGTNTGSMGNKPFYAILRYYKTTD